MEQDSIKQWLDQAVSGDSRARERLIEHHRAFIKKEAQRICRRYLEWGRDDELSLALIAFNESIDAYRKMQGVSFEHFARVVIRRRLVDYFRRSNSHTFLPGEKVISQIAVEEDWERSEREDEISRYRQLLNNFDINFKQVADAQPKHKETKERLRHVAKILAGNQELMEFLYNNRKLPKNRLCKRAGVTSRMLDRGRVYVIALALLLSHNDLPLLQDYAFELTGRGGK